MELQLQIKMNPHLYVRDPEQSELGRNIIRHSIGMIHTLGFEEFTFKKLAQQVGSTEASIYRYFENKHRLLTYITTWFWTWMEYQLLFHTNNVRETSEKINITISLLCFQMEDKYNLDHIDKTALHQIVISEGNKAYLTKHIAEDNKARLFKPYKDLCHRIAEIFLEYKPGYPFPHSLASTMIETAYHQLYFKNNLPSLTDLNGKDSENLIIDFLKQLVLSSLDCYKAQKS
ncbi:MAG: TetR/AcrR family transcriptional regulator [Chitinophagaceae bacterium]|nr:TetR/AcrR family transcriptional regulator [Chitinophagaceae bacterium]